MSDLDKTDVILDTVQKNYEETKELRKEIKDMHEYMIVPLQIEAKASRDHREKHCPRKHAILGRILFTLLGVMLTIMGFLIEQWLSSPKK